MKSKHSPIIGNYRLAKSIADGKKIREEKAAKERLERVARMREEIANEPRKQTPKEKLQEMIAEQKASGLF